MQTTLTVACLLSTVGVLGAADFVELPGSRVRDTAPAFSPLGRLLIESAEAMVSLPFYDGTPTRGDLLVLYDADTRHYLWMEETKNPKGSRQTGLMLLNSLKLTPTHAVFSSPDGISYWRSGKELVVHPSTETARNLDEAFSNSLAALRAHWDGTGRGVIQTETVDLGVDREVWIAYLRDPADLSQMTLPVPTIVGINWADGVYRVKLKARWTTEVGITADFHVKEPWHRVPE